jgi:hypothetical protein
MWETDRRTLPLEGGCKVSALSEGVGKNVLKDENTTWNRQ